MFGNTAFIGWKRSSTINTKQIGDISESMVTTELLKHGYSVLKPIGDRLPYDLAIDVDGQLIRFQIRTAWYNEPNDSYMGNVRCARTNRKNYSFKLHNYEKMDFFIYVIQSLEKFYVVPVSVMRLFKSGVYLIPHRPRRKTPLSLEAYCGNWELIKNLL